MNDSMCGCVHMFTNVRPYGGTIIIFYFCYFVQFTMLLMSNLQLKIHDTNCLANYVNGQMNIQNFNHIHNDNKINLSSSYW